MAEPATKDDLAALERRLISGLAIASAFALHGSAAVSFAEILKIADDIERMFRRFIESDSEDRAAWATEAMSRAGDDNGGDAP